MSRTKQVTQRPGKPLEQGQIWQMEDANLHIGLVGKRLVHYKIFKGGAKRSSNSLAGKEMVQKYLKENKAVLVQD